MTCARCGIEFDGFRGYIQGVGEVCHQCYIKHLEGNEK